MHLYENRMYLDDVNLVSNLELPWNNLKKRSVLVSGATGLVGSFLIDVLMEKNNKDSLDCTIYAIGRNKDKLKTRFSIYNENPYLVFVESNIQIPLVCDAIGSVDFVLHLASNTHPMLYSTDPIGTILTNLYGVKNLLDFSVDHHSTRFLFASSNEVYGENRGDVELFSEDYCGYINCNSLRAGYPESKRCGEALCQAYNKQFDLNIVIARLTRSFGPTMSATDSKAASQFIMNGVKEENIVLKSTGSQFFSYTYIVDAVSGLLTVLLNGTNGEAYNIADESCDIMLKDLASIIADHCGKKVVFEVPDLIEANGYSKASKARLNGSKLKALGWQPQYDIKSGICRTIDILKELQV